MKPATFEITSGSRAVKKVQLLSWLQGLVLTLVGLISLIVSSLALNREQVFGASLLLVSVALWNLLSWRLAGQFWFEPYPLFLIAAIAFNGGQAFLEVFSQNKNGILDGRFTAELVTQALYLVTIGLASLHFGVLLALGRIPPARRDPWNPVDRRKALLFVGYVCLGISIVPLIMVVQDAVTTAVTFGYGDLYGRDRGELLPGPITALEPFMVSGAMCLIAGSSKRKAHLLVASLLSLGYGFVMLAIGSRGPAVMILLAYIWLYNRSIQRLRRKVVVVLFVVLLLIFPVIATVRQNAGFWEDPVGHFSAAIAKNDNLAVSAISEMGYSLVTVVHTLRLIPDVRPFDYGIGYVYAASAVVPDIGWEVHPAISHGLFGDWLIRTTDPFIAARGGGLGFSFIAEVYANFGWLGTCPFLIAMGYFLGRLFNWSARGNDPAKLAFIATFMAFFLVFARGESAVILRGLAWYALFPYIGVSLITKARKARRARLRKAGLDLAPGLLAYAGRGSHRNGRL